MKKGLQKMGKGIVHFHVNEIEEKNMNVNESSPSKEFHGDI